jgi:8-hydroxy-5-deazaflavin:NADPH oxidoreductase
VNVAIVGLGNIGGGLARAWAKAGHEVVLVTRDPKDPETQTLVAETRARIAPLKEAVQLAEVIALAIPFAALDEFVRDAGPLTGKVLIDCTNAVQPGMKLAYGHTTSSAEEFAKKVPGVHVVRSFNAQGAENLVNTMYDGIKATNFYCGDDADAKKKVRRLIEDVGFDAVDVGGLSQSRLLEPLMLLWMAASREVGSRNVAFRLLRRT